MWPSRGFRQSPKLWAQPGLGPPLCPLCLGLTPPRRVGSPWSQSSSPSWSRTSPPQHLQEAPLSDGPLHQPLSQPRTPRPSSQRPIYPPHTCLQLVPLATHCHSKPRSLSPHAAPLHCASRGPLNSALWARHGWADHTCLFASSCMRVAMSPTDGRPTPAPAAHVRCVVPVSGMHVARGLTLINNCLVAESSVRAVPP